MTITTIGIDIGKSWFHIIDLNRAGKPVLKEKRRRSDLIVSKYVKSHLIRKLKSPLNPSTEVACMFSLRTGGHPCSSERTI